METSGSDRQILLTTNPATLDSFEVAELRQSQKHSDAVSISWRDVKADTQLLSRHVETILDRFQLALNRVDEF